MENQTARINLTCQQLRELETKQMTTKQKLLNEDFPDDNCCVIAMNRTFVKENPTIVKKIVQAVQKAHSWMRENPRILLF